LVLILNIIVNKGIPISMKDNFLNARIKAKSFGTLKNVFRSEMGRMKNTFCNSGIQKELCFGFSVLFEYTIYPKSLETVKYLKNKAFI